mgnify:CR=1 FL=1
MPLRAAWECGKIGVFRPCPLMRLFSCHHDGWIRQGELSLVGLFSSVQEIKVSASNKKEKKRIIEFVVGSESIEIIRFAKINITLFLYLQSCHWVFSVCVALQKQ